MKDFSLNMYKNLLINLKNHNFEFFPFKLYSECTERSLILRHDVDRLPNNSLKTAEMEKELDIYGTYFFRIVPCSFNEDIILKIKKLGHEIGYHYEDVDLIVQQNRSDFKKIKFINKEKLIDLAYESFCKNLAKIRKVVEVKSIAMHGSPLSKFDNKIIWDKYEYKKLGIVGDPYLELDWNEFLYLTDTGRKWNGSNVSVRDKVKSKYQFNFKTTFDIINNIQEIPNKIMINIHPQRWNDDYIKWARELVFQSTKNLIKKFLYVKK